MQPTPLPEIDGSDLKAVREFLHDGRAEAGPPRPHRPAEAPRAVPVRHGIARARTRSAAAKARD